jgi:hypothetical protein
MSSLTGGGLQVVEELGSGSESIIQTAYVKLVLQVEHVPALRP